MSGSTGIPKMLLGAIVLLVCVAFVVLWFQPVDVMQHFTSVAGAMAPLTTFLTVLLAILGWTISARAAGDEARRTEREKRDTVNAGHRGLVRARLLRVWGIVFESVLVFKPFQPDVVEHFIVQTEEAFWDKESFSAFDQGEQTAIRDALDRVRQDNIIAINRIRERGTQDDTREEICGIFLDSLVALEGVFRATFRDEPIADEIARSYATARDRDQLLRARQAQTTMRRP